ncbi:VirK/YbjX family protein [Pseudomonas nicosulfuronedens]
MRWKSIRKGGQRALAATFFPYLHWRWSRCIQGLPALSVSYKNGLPPAQKHWRKYLCRHWSVRRRLAALLEHYSQLDCLPGSWKERLLALGPVSLCQVPLKSGEALEVLLEPSDFYREGELGLYMRNGEGERLYSLSFTFGKGGQLLIGGLQGPRTTMDEGTVKWLGKEMFGLRPKNLLLTVLYTLGEQMGGRQLLGISDAAHTCSHKLKSSYDTFWQEAQASRHDRHWYRLPEREPVRDIAEVKSQRRSEFRRREALREEVSSAIRQAWSQEAVAAVAA